MMVCSSGGLYGTVAGVDDKKNTLWLKISGDVKIRVERFAITRVLTEAERRMSRDEAPTSIENAPPSTSQPPVRVDQ